MSMMRRRRIEVPKDMPRCRECGAECEKVQLAKIEDVEEGAVLAEIRCTNGHIGVRFLKPSQEAVQMGHRLAEHYGWADARARKWARRCGLA